MRMSVEWSYFQTILQQKQCSFKQPLLRTNHQWSIIQKCFRITRRWMTDWWLCFRIILLRLKAMVEFRYCQISHLKKVKQKYFQTIHWKAGLWMYYQKDHQWMVVAGFIKANWLLCCQKDLQIAVEQQLGCRKVLQMVVTDFRSRIALHFVVVNLASLIDCQTVLHWRVVRSDSNQISHPRVVEFDQKENSTDWLTRKDLLLRSMFSWLRNQRKAGFGRKGLPSIDFQYYQTFRWQTKCSCRLTRFRLVIRVVELPQAFG